MSRVGKVLFGSGIFVVLLGLLARLFYGEWDQSIYVLIFLGLVIFFTAIGKDFKFHREVMAMRTTKNGLSLGVTVIIVMTLLVFINYIGVQRNVKWDLTADKINSLSDQTVTLLKNLNEEVEFRAFFRPGANPQEDAMREAYENLIKMYQAENSKVKWFVYDPFKRKDLAEKYKIMTTGEIVVSVGDKQSTVSDVSEQVFTNALIKLTRNTKNVYSLTGHGERDLEEAGQNGIQQYKKYLTDEGYKLSSLSLAAIGKVPADAAVVMILGPTQAYSESETKALRDYLSKGGKIFLALDPGTRSNLGKLSSEMGIEFQNLYILDYYGQMVMKSANYSLGLQYSGTHEVTSKIKKVQTIFPIASPLRRAPGDHTAIVTDELIMTEQSAVTTKEATDGEAGKGEAKQQFTLAMAAKGKINAAATQEFSAVVVGDSDFISNQLIDVLGANRDLAMNIMASLSNDAEMISIRPKATQGDPMIWTSVQNGGLVFVIGMIPMLMYMCSMFVWWRRRGA